jgi:DNA gyrase subunit A
MAVAGKKIPITVEDEMRQSYMDYAMSVIVGRALPDVRDGLKPVHRRVLYAMAEMRNTWNAPFKKSARVVGDVIGKYHPHGDAAVYETLVRMAQEFSMRYPLVDGQGNFGSVDGDPPAAMRYTEVRMSRISDELLADIDRETVNFTPNYDDSTREPGVLPSRIPNLLINGTSGIAVGMATNIPPHNLREVVDGVVALLENPNATLEDLMEHVAGPDFPTGGFICGRGAIEEAYKTGRGILKIRAKAHTEAVARSGKLSIVITEIPFQVNKARLLERIAELVQEKKIEEVADLRDESDRDGMRIVVDLKREANAEVVLNQLYKHSSMEESFGVNLLALSGGRPRLLNLKEMLEGFLEHRKEVVTRRTAFDLRRARERLHVLDGLRITVENLERVLRIIRGSKDAGEARGALGREIGLSRIQAQAVLEMKLQRLTGIERGRIIQEHSETSALIGKLESVLADERQVIQIVRGELLEIRERYGDDRRTEIVGEAEEISVEDLIAEEEMVVTFSHEGYIKRSAVSLYKAQRRGGKGKIGATTREEDFVADLFVGFTRAQILFFTTVGKVYWLKVHEIPEASPAARGKAIVNLLHLGEGERISAFLPVREFSEDRFVFMATRMGVVKKTEMMAFSNPRTGGIIAIDLGVRDELVGVGCTDGRQEVFLGTKNGLAIRFSESEVRPMGRGAAGVRGIDLEKGDEVIGMEIVAGEGTILTVCQNGYGKRTMVKEYRGQGRGGKGVITIQTTDRNGAVVGIMHADGDDQVMIVTDSGRIIRLRVKDIPVIGRNTQGVRLIEMEPGEKVASTVKVAESEAEAETEG